MFDSARSLLFVPGDRPERFDRARDSGADAVIIDLEDAVSAERKGVARESARAWLTSGGEAVVRVSAVDSPDFGPDIEAIGGVATAIMVAKCQSPSDVGKVQALVERAVPVIPLIETAAGVIDVETICRSNGVLRVAMGNIDLAAELGVDPDDEEALRYVRSRIVLASAAAGLPGPIDGVTTDVNDSAVAAADAARARRWGFAGKLCIHPRQASVINEAFMPTQQELGWAREILERESDGLYVFDGRMVDAPVIARARGLLERERLHGAG